MPMIDAFVTHNTDNVIEPVAAVAPVEPPQMVDSARLLRGAREVLIQHGGECYRLRHTRNDKLILTK
jgi:hemin uptake protein HemP